MSEKPSITFSIAVWTRNFFLFTASMEEKNKPETIWGDYGFPRVSLRLFLCRKRLGSFSEINKQTNKQF